MPALIRTPTPTHGTMNTHGDVIKTMAGCGPNIDLRSSVEYTAINVAMHDGMAINFTGNAEYDFLAGMIPHHSAAVDMCRVYNQSALDAEISNDGIDSLCYNITFGPVSWGKWQFDFSQVGENEQMLEILEDLQMMDHYKAGCSGSSSNHMMMDTTMLMESRSNAVDSAMGHHGMFMGCGKLDLDQTKDYIGVNMEMHMRMAFNWTGHPGVDFLLGMIPHHQGAIAMCDIYYKYWSCAPNRTVCVDPLPLEEVQVLLRQDEEVSILNKMNHICNGHILTTQPKEVEWMLEELGRLSPEALAMYEMMQEEGTYPCPATPQHDGHGMNDGMSQHDEMANESMKNSSGHSGEMENGTMSHSMDHSESHDMENGTMSHSMDHMNTNDMGEKMITNHIDDGNDSNNTFLKEDNNATQETMKNPANNMDTVESLASSGGVLSSNLLSVFSIGMGLSLLGL